MTAEQAPNVGLAEVLFNVLIEHRFMARNAAGRMGCRGCTWTGTTSPGTDLAWTEFSDHVADAQAARVEQARAGEGALREARVDHALADLLRYYAERRTMNNPKGWGHVLRKFESAASDHYGLTNSEAEQVRNTIAVLAEGGKTR